MVVLIVDDERVVADSTAEIFRIAGHSAFVAYSATEALQRMSETGPDLLVTDVVMPKMSGIELAIRWRKEHPACKVLLISGQAETSDLLEQAEKRGYSFEIVAKPLWPRDLLDRAIKLVQGGSPKSTGAAAQA